jgi:P4 family phage/plasmid primase-like protien
MTDARKFLESVLVWPGANNRGWINLHVNAKNDPKPGEPIKNDGKPWVVGWPFKTVDDELNRVSWDESTADFFNVWVCMSQQSECTKKANGKLKAVRKAANATWLKAIWIDCDVKPGDPKHYHTMTEAFDALDAFRDKVGLPFPSMIVNSGGGLHIYWVSDTPMSPDEWRSYADGLKALLLREGVKCDTGLTTDAARILRVPGTLNHKYDPPRPVELLHYGTVYHFENDLLFLKQFNSAASTASSQQSEQPKDVIEPGAVFDAPVSAFAALTPDDALQAGCAPAGTHLVDPRPIFAAGGCGFLRHALKTYGADYDNPKWNLSVLCTAFMENGNAIAHQISEKHATYDQAGTQALYDRKVADRAERGIGYPSCAAIAGTGSEHCKTCPHFAKGKSPLNIRPEVAAPSLGGTQTDQANVNRLVLSADDHLGRARIYRGRTRPNLCHYRDDYYDHEAGHYTIVDDDTIRAELYGFLDTCSKEVVRGKKAEVVPFAPNKASVSETGEALKALGHVLPTVEQPHWLDGRDGPNPTDLICFPNGILNINTNEFTPPDPMLFTPHGVGFDYDPNAAAPNQWLNFLDEIFAGEVDQIASLQEAFGYCLSSDMSQEKVFMLLGDKRSGKDTTRHTLQSLLSPTAICGPTFDSMSTNFGMSQLIGKQLAVVGDMRLGARCDKDQLAEHVLKLSGRGLFTIDRKNKSHWTGTLPCKLWLLSNEMPKLKDASGALASRFVTYHTRTSFYGREDRQLFENKIRPQLPAILLWSLDGLRRMRARGPIAEPACSVETREELAREGSPIMAFVQQCLTLDATAKVEKDALYSAYLVYAHDSGLQPTSKSWFFRDLATATASKVKAVRVQAAGGDREHYVVGARIRPPNGPTKCEELIVNANGSANNQNLPSPMHPIDRSVAPSPSQAALIAKDFDAAERFANRRVV